MSMSRKEIRAAQLWKLLDEVGPQTVDSVLAVHPWWSKAQVYQAVQTLRDGVGDPSSMTVTCDPDPSNWRGPWIITLRRGDTVNDRNETRWMPNRTRDVWRRLKTMLNVEGAAVRATDGRTREGRVARIVFGWLETAVEEAEQEVARLDD